MKNVISVHESVTLSVVNSGSHWRLWQEAVLRELICDQETGRNQTVSTQKQEELLVSCLLSVCSVHHPVPMRPTRKQLE